MSLYPSYLLVSSRRYRPESAPVIDPPGYSYYMHREDRETNLFDGGVRGCAVVGCPAVMVINDAPDTIFDKQWQYFVFAINKGMTLNAIIAVMGDAKALFNNTGFGDENDPRANWLTGSNLTFPSPRLDKLRTFSRNTHAGIEIDGKLQLMTFDGTKPPPLKPGKVYPGTLADVDPNAYLYMPWNAPHLFCVCNNIRNKSGGQTSIFPFDNGIPRPWTGDGEIYTFFPLVSRYKITVPLRNWMKLPEGEKVSPYRRVS